MPPAEVFGLNRLATRHRWEGSWIRRWPGVTIDIDHDVRCAPSIAFPVSGDAGCLNLYLAFVVHILPKAHLIWSDELAIHKECPVDDQDDVPHAAGVSRCPTATTRSSGAASPHLVTPWGTHVGVVAEDVHVRKQALRPWEDCVPIALNRELLRPEPEGQQQRSPKCAGGSAAVTMPRDILELPLQR